MIELFKETHFDFIGKRMIFFAFSGVSVLLGLIGLIQIGRGAANLGVDFSGGTAIALRFENPIEIAPARAALSESGFGEAELQEVVAEKKLFIRIRKEGQGDMDKKITSLILKAYPKNPFVLESSTEIGPKIGQKLQKDALIAIAISMLGIVLYIALRFEFQFGVAAALATFHDVFFLVGIFYLLNKEISLLFVTALLTIAGYSLSDTVVLFDRIRENLKKEKRDPFTKIINDSINQTLARTFNTGFSTLLVVLVLFFVGGEVIHDFALAMLLGILVGTYSSWFIASSLLITLRGEQAKRA